MDLYLKNKDNDFFYNTFFKNNVTPMLITDFQTMRIVDANLAACSFYQYSYEEILSLKITDINILPNNKVMAKMNLVVNHVKSNFLFKHRMATGEIKDVSVHAGLIHIGRNKYLHSIVNDISDRKDTIDEISKLTSQMNVMLDNLPFIAWIKDTKDRYIAVNRPFENYCGRLKEEIIGKRDCELFAKNLDDMYLIKDSSNLTERKNGHFIEKYENGRWKEEYKSPVIDEYGNMIGTTGLSRDITERKLLDKALHDAELREKQLLKETIEIKDNFITLITHEFKTPITIINAALQTIEIVCKDDITDKMKGYLNKIHQNSLRQQRLVDNLLDITRIKAGQMKVQFTRTEIVSYTREITESVKVFAQQKKLDLTFHTSCPDEMITLDQEKYERILLNLLSNAIKFTPPMNTIGVRLSTQGNFIKIEVKDRGIGIPKNKQAIIFEQFGQADSSYSRQAEGTGIGLYLVKSLVDTLGGSISLKSKVNRGSTFTILLPKVQNNYDISQQKISGDRIQQAASLELSDIIF
ncbi:sensor histidine kinase [Sinanaerobacter chloroacetimidivorans]|jgi:PAS domain S-box-containing protein|uniref:histidine kinase n=1 Tax=Sinanaerobacter chloroacetimidivorans TaxID=2818044 RepID=A0A8J7W457_9FIRM|nr:PAS domain-containing sensor histidine kinase [Sinanaerobacter chloroacetimidivorans]MBR0600617.1 PAS domain-containing sensor histidine kinase [Sinanaerobacter chloroacetimidivorans]